MPIICLCDCVISTLVLFILDGEEIDSNRATVLALKQDKIRTETSELNRLVLVLVRSSGCCLRILLVA